jgi:hypothetical protein
MLVANIVVETLPGRARTVAQRMERLRGMGGLTDDGDHRVEGTWKVPEGDTLEGLSEVLQAMNPEILQVYPTLVGRDDDGA